MSPRRTHRVGSRPPARIARALIDFRHYRALVRSFRAYQHPLENLRRYLFDSGDYPYRCQLRTPVGRVALTLYGSHDMRTVNEIFCRGDYPAPRGMRMVVDFGSNIGISAAYFLTRDANVRCYLVEPDPRNIARLRKNLAPFEGRWMLGEHAVADFEGEVDFAIEDTGRYGRIDLAGDRTIRVAVLHANDVLASVLSKDPWIDMLKLDIEGLETRVVKALRPDLLGRIRSIVFEGHSSEPLHPEIYRRRERGSCTDLVLWATKRPRSHTSRPPHK